LNGYFKNVKIQLIFYVIRASITKEGSKYEFGSGERSEEPGTLKHTPGPETYPLNMFQDIP